MRGALVPHAPLLLPEVTQDSAALRDLWDGLSRIRLTGTELVVVFTPHSRGTGVYKEVAGSLAGFGRADIAGAFPSADVISERSLGGPIDHGALVPLLLLRPENQVVVVGLGGATETSDMSDMSDVLGWVRALSSERDLFVVASAHTSARLSERAPLPYSFDSVRLEARFIEEIERDCVAARDLAHELSTVGDSCSRTTLAAFGRLFSGAEGSVLAYGAPFGVGYPVIMAERDV